MGILLLAFLVWYFRTIHAYLAFSAVLSLMGRPITDFLLKLGYKKFRMPHALSATLTLVILFELIFLFFRIFIPIVVHEARELSGIDYSK